MILPRFFTKLLTAVLLAEIAFQERSAANPFDFFGLDSRGAALSGALSSDAKDGSGAYYNPAALTLSGDFILSVCYLYESSFLSAEVKNFGSLGNVSAFQVFDAEKGFDEAETKRIITEKFNGAASIEPLSGITISALLPFKRVIDKLDRNVTLGSIIFFPDNALSIVKIEGLTPNDPTFPIFGRRLQRLVAMVGLGVEIIPGILSLGGGITILTDIKGSVVSLAPISVFNPDNLENPPPPQPGSAVFKQDLLTEPALNFGLLFTPAEWVSFAIVRRGGMSLNLDFDVQAGVAINFGTRIEAMIPYSLESNFFYIPEQYVFGARFSPFTKTSLMLDLTWKRTGNLKDNLPITKFHIKEEALGEDGEVLSLGNIGKFRVTNETMPEVSTKDVVVPRIGIEQTLFNGLLELRGGYSYHQSPFANNKAYDNFILDNSFHSLTLGAGLNFKDPAKIFLKPLTFALHFQTLLLNPHYNRVGKKEPAGNHIGKGVVLTSGYFIGTGATLITRF